ncbi:hypothetical protein DB345_08375 [Spartobacteria bacterium LR76]|nr:hypothetical protein DB345_08375 [Spartobacteria bacterium LR76]
MTDDTETMRDRARHALQRYFTRRALPRFTLGLILIFTGTAGFGLSLGLLKLGVTNMAVRYPVAVMGAYGVFLLLIRLWVELEKSQFNPDDAELQEDFQSAPPSPYVLKNAKSRTWDWLDFVLPDEGSFGLFIVLSSIVAIIATICVAIAGAPLLIAEIFVDIFLASVLYRRLRIAAEEHWLGAAVRRTWLHVLITAAALAVMGLTLEICAPGSDTIGQALKRMIQG